jgi:hypothetical protein
MFARGAAKPEEEEEEEEDDDDDDQLQQQVDNVMDSCTCDTGDITRRSEVEGGGDSDHANQGLPSRALTSFLSVACEMVDERSKLKVTTLLGTTDENDDRST